MDSGDDALVRGLASGDTYPGPREPSPVASGAAAAAAALKREHDSTDDFEHLDGESRPEESPGARQPRAATQSFLDMERDGPAEPARSFPLHDTPDHIADKFTDSESDADTAGESPLHRAAPPAPPAPLLDLLSEPVPTAPVPAAPVTLLPEQAAPAPAPAPAAAPAPAPVVKAAPAPAPVPTPAASAPQPPPPESPPPPPVAAEPARAPLAHVIEAEVIFCQMGLVESLIYWRVAARSGAALGAGLALLVALACCSVVSVLAYASLLALSAAVAFRIYKNILQAVQKTNDGHPFKWLLEQDISVPAERAQSLAAAATAHLNAAANELRRLFLVEDLVDSLKFGVLLWCLTYVGACFNGITLIILGWIALFTLPKAYEMNKPQVDANLELARAKINDITAKVRAAVPIGRKAESEKDK